MTKIKSPLKENKRDVHKKLRNLTEIISVTKFYIMPRLARIDAPGVIHHIIIRGIERREIFKDDKDRDDIIDRLSTILPETHTKCFAWALMPNHAHFLFKSGENGISTVMRRLLTGYAVSFNRKYSRHGQLFQNRYKSVICQEDKYLLELVRYIHLNPLRGNIITSISELCEYPYSGHSALMNTVKRGWQDLNFVLNYFGKEPLKSRKAYQRFVKEGVGEGHRPELVGGGLIRSLGGWSDITRSQLGKNNRIKSDERILGDGQFVSQVLAEANDALDRKNKVKKDGYNISVVERKVTHIFGIEIKALYSGRRKKKISEARSVFCFWCVKELGESMTSIAKRLGLSQPAVGYAVDRGEKLIKERGFKLVDKLS